MLNKVSLISFIFIFFTASVFADFDITKKIKPIVLSNNTTNCSWNYYNDDDFTKGLANIFEYNKEIYITYVDNDYKTIQIKKLNKNTKTLESFISINVENKIVLITEEIKGCSVMMETSDDCYIFFFYDSDMYDAYIKVSLKTKQIEQGFINNNKLEQRKTLKDAVVYNNKIYILYYCYYHDHSDDNYCIYVLNANGNVEHIIKIPDEIPKPTLPLQTIGHMYYTTLMFYNGNIRVYGYAWVGFWCYLYCNVDITNDSTRFGDAFDAGGHVWRGRCVRSLTYQSNGKTYAYVLSVIYETIYKTHEEDGFYVITGEETLRFINGKNNEHIFLQDLFANNTGFYTGYLNNLDKRRIGFFKRSLDGKEVLGEMFYIDDTIITNFQQNNSMFVTEIDGKQQMLLLASGDNDSTSQTVLYFFPIDSVSSYFYVEEDGFMDGVLNPKTYSTNEGQFTYKFEYANYQNKAPSSLPVLYIYNNGQSIKSDGFTMNPVDYNDTNYTDGKVYSYTTKLSEIGKIKETDNYTYRIKIGENYSKEYAGPFYYGEEPTFTITDYDGTYILPKGKINPNTEVSIQMTYSYTVGEMGELANDYPKVLVYNKNDLVNPIGTYTMSYIAGSSNGYSAKIGTYPVGEYKYKIVAKNKTGLEKEVNGTFSCRVNETIIADYDGSYIIPKGNIIKPNTAITFQMKYTGDEGIPLESGYPKVDIYSETDLLNPIKKDTMSQISGSTNGYSVNMGGISVGKYKYKITAKNEFVEEKTVEGTFSIQELTSKCYNAPNPFNPQAGERTKIFFEMLEDGSVEIDIYSEYGDKIYHTSIDGLSKGINSIEYTGRDDRGDILYNGTYVCVVKKKYLGTTKKEKCRLLVIK